MYSPGPSPAPPSEDEIRHSEARFRTIFEQSPVSTQIFTPDGLAVAVNRAWEALWGVTLEQISPYNILHDHQLVDKGIMPFVERGFAGEAVDIPAIKYEPEQTRAGVSSVPFRWVSASMYPVRDVRGEVREVVLTHQDITDRKIVEEALRESEERFRAIFEDAPLGIALIDAEGRYRAVNPVRQEMLGYSEDELLGRRYTDLTHEEDVDLDREVNEEARRQGRSQFGVEKRFVRKNGSLGWTRISVSTVRDELGEAQYFVSVAEDITERKEAEAAQRLLQQQKDDFLSAVAHDLRTPLTTIKGRVQLLRHRAARGNVETGRLAEDLARIDSNTSRMMTLINELLDVANLQLGRPLHLARRPVDLADLVRLVVNEHQAVADKHPIEVHAPPIAVVGWWDASRLERVLANLLSNAIKYSPQGGPISVRVEQESGGWATLAVTDHGIGIPPDDLSSIFERFHRGSNAAGRISGTGIGLAAVRDIVQQHGGTVGVESREGHGTTFTVRLPLEARPADRERETEAGVQGGRPPP